jgi:hypothetical protein
MVKRPTPELSKDQLRKLLETIKNSKSDTARRDYLIFKLIIVHNFKPGWAVGTDRPVVADVEGGIHIEDLIDDSKVRVRIWSGQTRESAEVDIGRETMKELRWFAGDRRQGKLFEISQGRIEQLTKKYCEEAGIPSKHIRLEAMRNRLNPSKPVSFQVELSWVEDDIMRQAQRMTYYYLLNYCIENSIRGLISKTLADKHGTNWWSECASPDLQKEVENRRNDERNLPGALRSESPLDYLLLRELWDIIKANWADFSNRGLNRPAMSHAFVTLNQLRKVIAHNVELPEREKKRFEIFEADWRDLLAGS